ncbi:MAG TPA: nucleoside-diphosphate sugar epimerase/dehydratase [Virgibacillus sp.]|nr:nucleoside-diphosphate sugar epimerase/dehydratase [Virgibacillus sp.]
MTYKRRLILLVLLDSIIVTFAIFTATWLVYPNTPGLSINILLISAIALLMFHHLFAVIYKLYHKVWAYASVGELLAIVKAVTLSIVATGLVQFLVNDLSIYRRALVVTWLIHIVLIGGSRFVWRVVRDNYVTSERGEKRTLIVGAGSAGTMVARQLQNNHEHSELFPIAFVDDDISKQRMEVYGIPVLGKIKDIKSVVEEHHIDHVVIAIPSLRSRDLNKIVFKCNETKAKVKMIPKIEDLMTGKVAVSQLKSVEVEDLLGRQLVELDIGAIKSEVTGHTVMVTGAGGSIGSELCRQLMEFKPREIILVGHGEYSIYTIDMELRETFGEGNIDIIPVIGDVKDQQRMLEIVGTYRPVIIYHAAAHKHVPLMEYNPHEAVNNNIIGTNNIAEAAHAFGVNTFVLISSDKAVNPTNVMGATKRIAEMVIQDLNSRSKTKFVAVRFGNVLGSRGSVIPLFKRQIEQGGPVTVTHPEMTRYFMTIPEASRLVIQAGTLASEHEVFVLDMGEPVKIVELARNLITLSGYTEEETGIAFSGIRPGEKMFEELLGTEEILPGEVYEKIYVGRTVEVDMRMIKQLLEDFHIFSVEELKEQLMTIVYQEKEQQVGFEEREQLAIES